MLDYVQKYLVAVIAGALAVLSLIGVTLSLTVLRPDQEVSAVVSPQHPIVMTRGGVLPLFSHDVTVRVQGVPDRFVGVVAGSSVDVLGWIGQAAYTEVIGVESDREHLKVAQHAGSIKPGLASGDNAQSAQGTQSANSTQTGNANRTLDGIQSGDVAQSGTINRTADALLTTMLDNDMWLHVAHGQGEATLKLTGTDKHVSILVASDEKAPDLRLTWSVQRTNVLLIVSAIFAALFTLITVAYVLRQIFVDRSRAQRALDIEARRHADLTDTQSISLQDIVDYAQSVESQKDTPSVQKGAHTQLPTRTLTISGVLPLDDVPSSRAEALPTGQEMNSTADSSLGQEHTPAEDSSQAGSQLRGRHSLDDQPHDIDPPETVPTDTGTIDLTGIRPGVVLPSRRAIREARERGESSLTVEGHEFDTGLIPQIKRVNTPTSGETHTVEAQVDEYIPAQHTSDAASDSADTSDNTGWKSMISTWRRRSGRTDQEKQ